jgi:hypothetical protein
MKNCKKPRMKKEHPQRGDGQEVDEEEDDGDTESRKERV